MEQLRVVSRRSYTELSLCALRLFMAISKLLKIDKAPIPQKRGFSVAMQHRRCSRLVKRIRKLSGASSDRQAFRVAHIEYQTVIQRAPWNLMLWGSDMLYGHLYFGDISADKLSTAFEILNALPSVVHKKDRAAGARCQEVAEDIACGLREDFPELFGPEGSGSTARGCCDPRE